MALELLSQGTTKTARPDLLTALVRAETPDRYFYVLSSGLEVRHPESPAAAFELGSGSRDTSPSSNTCVVRVLPSFHFYGHRSWPSAASPFEALCPYRGLGSRDLPLHTSGN